MRYDIIGDVHGCFDELAALLRRLGHAVEGTRLNAVPGRQVVFVGHELTERSGAALRAGIAAAQR